MSADAISSRPRSWAALLGCAVVLAGPALPSCGGPRPEPQAEGAIEFRFALVPADVRCLRFIAQSQARTVIRALDVSPGTSGVYTLEGVPTGNVMVGGEAFDLACDAVTMASIPTWVSDAVAATIPPGTLTSIALSFRRNGRIDVTVIFDEGGAAGSGGSPSGGTGGSAPSGTGGGSGATGGSGGAGGAAGGTAVGGILNQDANWTAAGSPYRLTREVQVAPGVTLTIDAATTVEGNGFAITTWGTLRVAGLAGSEVRFRDVALNPGASSAASPAVMLVDRAILDGGRLWYATGSGAYGSLTLTNSVVRDTLAGSFIYIWYPQANCTIEGNVFIRSGGISIGSDGREVLVKNNVFFRPTTGWAVQNWASYRGASITLTRNTFLDTAAIAVELPPDHTSAAVDARENFWNTTDAAVIDGMIFDRNDDLRSASVIPYLPFLSGPDPATPDYAPWVN